jgi:hypothetical protein
VSEQHAWGDDADERAIPTVPGPRRPRSYSPLHKPDGMQLFPGTVAQEIAVVRQYLDQVAAANIHDHTTMLKAAVGLDHCLRSLLAALDAERGER